MSIKNTPILQEHKSNVINRVSEISNHIAEGKCTSFDDYKKQCGIILGLEQSLQLMDEAIKTYTNDFDEDD